MKGKVSNTGYKKNSKDKNNDYNIIPTNRITMKNVDFPVLGISDKNDIRVMYPGEEHLFDGNSVLEYRMAKNGINQQDQKVDQQLKQLTDFSNDSLNVGGNIKKSNIMKSQFLKIAGVKTDKAFYKKYPTEAAFFKAHPEAKKMIKKAQAGVIMPMMNSYVQGMQNVPNMQNVIQGQMQSPGVYSSTPNYGQMYMNMSTEDEQLKQPQGQQPNTDSIMKGGMNVIGGMFNAAKAMKAQKEALKNARMWADVSGVVKRAAISNQFAEKPKNTWIRPDDQNQIANINQMYPGQGVGTNALARNGARLEDGGMVGGNPTEIQNTYGDGNSIYDDLGYTPLIDENQQKSFYHGGNVPRAQFGIASAGMEGFGENPYSSLTGSMFNNSGGSQMGSAVGSMFGPFGGLAGGMIGGMLDKTGGKTKDAQQRFQRNMDYVAGIDSTAGIHNQFNSVMEDGGWVSNDWNPQVITMFGDVDDQDFAQFAHKDEFRAGGHIRGDYRQPNQNAFKQSAENGTGLDGSLEPMWGGTIKDVSYNPYIGNMAMGFGNDHDESDGYGNTGIGMKVLDDGGEVTGEVEIETKEPMINTGDSVTVLGARIIPKQLKLDLNIKKGNSFKKAGEEIGKQDNKINKKKEKLVEEYSKMDDLTPFGKLGQVTKQMMIKGLEDQQKINANKLMSLSSYQNDSEEISNSLGYEDVNKFDKDLEKGKLNQGSMMNNAKFGGKFTKAQDGKKAQFNSEKEALAAGYIKDANGFYRIIPPEKLEPIETKVAEAMREVPLQHKDASGLYGGASSKLAQVRLNNPWFEWEGFNPANEADVKRFQKAFNERARSIGSSASLIEDGLFGDQTASALINEKRMTQPSIGRREEAEILEADTKPVPYKRSGLIDFGNQLLDYIRPTDQEPFDYGQTMGEQYALATNQLEPVQAQLYKPEIGVPYDISYQDVLNENQADFNAQTRKTGYNPAAQSNLNAQKYMANQRVLGEQFRANQAMKDKVYTENRNTLNQAKLTNLGILDKQYERQSEAMSNTKATTQAVLNSISDKLAKHKLENRTLGVYENLYKYRFDDKGRAINMNGIFQPNIPTVASKEGTQRRVPVYEADGKTIKYYQLEEYDPSENGGVGTPPINAVAKNGKSITKKNNKNSSIVKAIKNL